MQKNYRHEQNSFAIITEIKLVKVYSKFKSGNVYKYSSFLDKSSYKTTSIYK